MKTHSFRQFADIQLVFAFALLAAVSAALLAQRSPAPSPQSVEAAQKACIAAGYGKLPLAFEPNQGQAPDDVNYVARGQGYTLALTARAAVLQLSRARQSATLKLQLAGANPAPHTAGLETLAGKSNYITGNDHSRWRHDIPNFAKVKYDAVYPGIDLVYYGQQRQLEYDFVVAPGADPNQIAIEIEGAEKVRLDAEGQLVLQTAAGEVVQHAPLVYQETATGRQAVTGKYVMTGARQVGFEIGTYDARLALVIDPLIGFSTYLGSENIQSLALDAAGNVYVAGRSVPANLPGSSTIGTGTAGGAFIAKLDPGGTSLIYATFFPNIVAGFELAEKLALAVDETGSAYLTGGTRDPNFPLQNALQGVIEPDDSCFLKGLTCRTLNGLTAQSDAFVLKLTPAGNDLVFSTYLGGNGEDTARSIAVSTDHKVYVTGTAGSTNFPATSNAFQGDGDESLPDAFLTVFAADGQSLVYSTYFSSRKSDHGFGVALDSAGNAYIAGYSEGGNLPTKGASGAPPFQADNAGGTDAFIAKFNPALSGNNSLIYATYLGGAGTDVGLAIAVDSTGKAYVTGHTGSTGFPLAAVAGASVLDTTNVVNEAYVSCLNATGTALVFSTFLGGSSSEGGQAIALDGNRNIYLTGFTNSTNFPLAGALQSTLSGQDAFVTKLTADARQIAFSTLLGGSGAETGNTITVDTVGNILVAGSTASNNFPTTPDVFQPSQASGGFITKYNNAVPGNPDTIGVYNRNSASFLLSNSLPAGTGADIIAFLGNVNDRAVTGDWNGDGVDTIGVFRDGTWFLHNANESTGTPDITVSFGQAGDVPLAGDWNGDGIDTIGLYRPSTGQFLLRKNNNTATGPFNNVIIDGFGGLLDKPVAGDWDGNGTDTVGLLLFAQTGAPTQFRLLNANATGSIFITVSFGQGGDLPVAGDWDGDGIDTIGVFRNGVWLIRKFSNSSTAVANNLIVSFGNAGELPLTGDWNGQP